MATDSSEQLVLLNKLAEEFAARYRKGERPTLDEYVDRHPELADDIREFFPAMAEMELVREARQEVSEPDAAGPLPPLERLGDFRIIRQIGHGGMGVVYEAEQVSLGRHVALKVLPRNLLLDTRTRRRFEREAKAAARLHHTNIVPVFGIGEHEGLPYYVMQFIQGLGLDVVLAELKRAQGRAARTGGPSAGEPGDPHRNATAANVARPLLAGDFPPISDGSSDKPAAAAQSSAPTLDRISDGLSLSSSSVSLPGAGTAGTASLGKYQTYWQSVARVGVQVADALAYAHQQGIEHRDIKPSNLLLDTHGTVWVTDFGLAKADDKQNLTHTGDLLGTLRYMSPEAFDGKTDARSDIYSLGLTLYETLTLQPAFDERERHRLIKQVTTGEPARLDRLQQEIPRDLVTIVHKCIDRKPAGRYATAAELAADLRRFIADEPIKARRISSVERLGRWARHNRALAGSLAVIGLLVVTVAVGASVAAILFQDSAARSARLADEREDARRDAERAGDEARRRGDAERWERYCSNIAAASGAMQLQNTGTARTALEKAPAEHRNWEWQYFHNQLDGARLVLPIPGGSVAQLGLSPSGRQLAVCSENHNAVYLYDVAAGRLETVLRGHSSSVVSVEYHPLGKQVAASASDHTIHCWDQATGQELLQSTIQYARPVVEGSHYLTYSPDGSRIVSFVCPGQPGTIRLWDTATGKQIAVLGEEWKDISHPVAFRPDGKQVAAGSRDFVHLHDAVTGKRLAVLGPHDGPVAFLTYSPDGKRIASAGRDDSGTIWLWDETTGKQIGRLAGHTSGLLELLFSPDGSRLLSASSYADDTARLWDAATGRLLAVLTGHKNSVHAAQFSPDGRWIATASLDQTARLWDGRTGKPLAVLGGHTAQVKYVLFRPGQNQLITASEDATLRLWDTERGELISVLRGHGAGFAVSPVFTPDGSRLVTGSRDGTVRIWDMSLLERNGILRGHTTYVYDVAFSPKGEQVASASWDGTARLWDSTTGRQTGQLKHETGKVSSVAYGRDGRHLVTVERDRGVTLWDVVSQKPIHSWQAKAGYWRADPRATLNPVGTLVAAGCIVNPGTMSKGPVRLWDVARRQEVAQFHGHDGCSIDVAFHPDGNLLATAGEDGVIHLWDMATREPRAVLRGHTGPVWRVAFGADGKLLASGSDDKTIRFWDAQTGDAIDVITVASVVYGLAFSPDGTRLAAGCVDNTVRLFDVAQRQQVAELRGHSGYVHAVAWSPDGTQLASASGDSTVRIWDALSPAVRARPPDAYFPPRGYVCYRANSPITLDGKLDDAAWEAAPWTDDFVDIEGDRRLKPRFRTRAKMLWDDRYFYIGVELEEPHVQGTYTLHDSYIFHEDNDFEVFLNPDGNNHHYAELEMNALNTTWDLRLRKPYRDHGAGEDDWEIPGLRTAVHRNGTINNPRDVDTGWSIEIAIPWEIVGALRDNVPSGGMPRDGDQWRVNFSRVEWRFDIVDGKYVRRVGRPEDNWVWSPQGAVNMHQPETWGYVQFSTAVPGQAAFRPDQAGAAKHLLHRIYHAQSAFKKEHLRYAATLAELGLADIGQRTLAAPPQMELTDSGFQASADIQLAEGKRQRWSIREDSLVWLER